MLIIGTILNTKARLNAAAYEFVFEVKKSRIPFITKELLDSPGCTLAVNTTPFLFPISYADPLSVIVSTSTRFPASVLHSRFL